jgi:hypothetical protein
MKKFLSALSSVVLLGLVFSEVSLASGNSLAKKVLGRSFCEQGRLNTGIGFSLSGEVGFFAPNIGRPDPSIVFKAEFIERQSRVRVVWSRRDHSAPEHSVGSYFYNSNTDSLEVSTGERFSPAWCQGFR